MEYYSAIKKEILPFAMVWVELEGIMLSEISQSEKELSYDLTDMWNVRNKAEDHRGRENKFIKKHNHTCEHKEQTDGCQREGVGDDGKMNEE